jgi:hypothetical protein
MSDNQDLKQIKEYLARNTWDFPVKPDEMRIPQYDANGNPVQIDFYVDGVRKFTHALTWNATGDLERKKLIFE